MLLDGQDSHHCEREEFGARIGYLPQDVQLLDTDVFGASCKTPAFVASGDAASAILRGCCGIAWYSAAAERFWVTSGKPMAALPRNGGKALMSCLGANALR